MKQTIKKGKLQRIAALFCVLGMFFIISCDNDDDKVSGSAFELSSSESDGGFDPGGVIPDEFRYNIPMGTPPQCDGDNSFPKLVWGDNSPDGTESFVLIVDDPDAMPNTWVHLNLYDIPKSRVGIPRLTDAMPTDHLSFESDYGTAGPTDWSENGWGGPCPPSGTHTYYFKLYAVNENPLDPPLSSAAARSEFESVYEDKILESTEISGEAAAP